MSVSAGQAPQWLNIMRQQHSSTDSMPVRGQWQVRTTFSPLTYADGHTQTYTIMHTKISFQKFNHSGAFSDVTSSDPSPINSFTVPFWFLSSTEVLLNPITLPVYLILSLFSVMEMRRPASKGVSRSMFPFSVRGKLKIVLDNAHLSLIFLPSLLLDALFSIKRGWAV